MHKITVVLLAAVLLTVGGDHLQVGVSVNNLLAYTEEVRLSAIPLTTRTKNVFYNGNDTRIIRGITAVDMDNSKGKATITSGGVGFTFANVRIRSERGDRLNYQVQIFV